MVETIVEPLETTDTADVGICRRRWTRKEYYRAAAVGILRPDERLELLDGEILQKMSPQLTPHATAISLGAAVLGEPFGLGHYIRQQLPIILDDESEPEPDLLVVPGGPRDYLGDHPKASAALLLVEVSDSTLVLDQGRKRAAYARAGVAEYWIENLRARRLEVYRDPVDEEYQSVTHHSKTDVITPLAAPNASIAVSDLLP